MYFMRHKMLCRMTLNVNTVSSVKNICIYLIKYQLRIKFMPINNQSSTNIVNEPIKYIINLK